jgi:hypothetical protein
MSGWRGRDARDVMQGDVMQGGVMQAGRGAGDERVRQVDAVDRRADADVGGRGAAAPAGAACAGVHGVCAVCSVPLHCHYGCTPTGVLGCTRGVRGVWGT